MNYYLSELVKKRSSCSIPISKPAFCGFVENKQNTSVEHMVIIYLIVESHAIGVTKKDTYHSATMATVQ